VRVCIYFNYACEYICMYVSACISSVMPAQYTTYTCTHPPHTHKQADAPICSTGDMNYVTGPALAGDVWGAMPHSGIQPIESEVA